MEIKKTILRTIFAFLILNSIPSNAQFFKKLKEKVKKEAGILTEEIIDERLNGKDKEPSPSKENEKQKSINDSADSPRTDNKGEDGHVKIKDGILFKSPNENFINFELQSYKGLPRFGMLTKDLDSSSEKELERYYEIYSSLIELKYLKDISIDELRAENLGIHSDQTINGVKRVTYLSSTQETFLKYFCNETIGSCKTFPYRIVGDMDRTPGSMGGSKNGVMGHWGGKNATEFQQKRSFDSFLQDDYNTLKEWSEDIWADGFEIGYLVSSVTLDRRRYDFKNQGYWLNIGLKSNELINLSNNTFSPLQIIVRYIPDQRFEKEPEAQKGNVFFKIAPEKAEELEERNIDRFFVVQKIKLGFYKREKTYNKRYRIPHKFQFKYNVESPIIELYEDLGLTKKMGEVSLEEGLFK
ncbi:hypothetical protein [Flagellimonas olearia]|uniref:Uncharacterized protein n=1 Tax=Flagellimonas olearia TaxID=552546 RepID=A0A444VJB3_9FLAO|nr:hypothetical protein [Allomuricauda olearia]RYC50832.1 hypothetical protein DN53_17105 [Allomuricauda olearia]